MTYYTLLSKDWKEVASSYNKDFLVTYAYFVSTSINRDDIYQLVPWTTSIDYKKHNLRNVKKGIGIRYFRDGRDVTQECIDNYLKIQRKWDELEESHKELYYGALQADPILLVERHRE